MSLTESGLVPGLWVVATPIGNLSDLSIRARKALENADAVLAEDTRRAQALLSSLGISKRCERFDEHSDDRTLAKYVEALKSGRSLALVTDAGTPGISDPGGRIVAKARAEGVPVQAIAGPSAVTAALSVSGLELSRFAFLGFLPRKEAEVQKALEGGLRFVDDAVQESDASGRAAVSLWFESPERIQETVGIFQQTLNSDRYGLFLAKEITKVFEKIWVGSVQSVVKEFQDENPEVRSRGEWIIGVFKTLEPAARAQKISETNNSAAEMPSLSSMQAAKISAQILCNAGVATSVAAKQISQQFGVDRAEIYAFIVSLKSG